MENAITIVVVMIIGIGLIVSISQIMIDFNKIAELKGVMRNESRRQNIQKVRVLRSPISNIKDFEPQAAADDYNRMSAM